MERIDILMRLVDILKEEEKIIQEASKVGMDIEDMFTRLELFPLFREILGVKEMKDEYMYTLREYKDDEISRLAFREYLLEIIDK